MALWLDSGRRRKRACNTRSALYNQRWRRRRIGPAMHFRFRRRHGRRLIGNRRPSYRWAAVFFSVMILTPSPARPNPMFPRWRRHFVIGRRGVFIHASPQLSIMHFRFPASRPPAHRRQRYQIHITPAAGATVAQGKSSRRCYHFAARQVIHSRRARRSVIGCSRLLQHVGFQAVLSR